MSGYSSRTKPAEGKEHDLYVKALALEDADGGRLVLVTSDLLGLPRSLSESVATEVTRKTKLPRERLMLTCSHTHCSPVLDNALTDMYDLPAGQKEKIAAYTKELREKLVDVVVASLADLKPAKLSIGAGTARFAMNRREVTAKGVINGRNPEGPVDHSVPVLRVETPEGKLRAVVFGYACHNTTMQYLRLERRLCRLRAAVHRGEAPRRPGAVLDRLRRRRQSAAAQQDRAVPEVWPGTRRRRRRRPEE